MKLKNRIVMTAMGTRLSSETMGVSDRNIDYFVERAKGGVSLIITGCTYVAQPGGVVAFPRLSVASEGLIPGLNRLCDAVHYYDSKIAFQLFYPEINQDGVELGPSNIPASLPIAGLPITRPRPMNIEEIKKMIQDTIRGAKIAKMAGADAVQINAAHGHLLGQFLSPLFNRRSDRFGGTVEGRAQLIVDLIRGIKEEVGGDFPVMVKFNHTDYVQGGIEVEEAKIMARLFQEAGADALEPSAALIGRSMDYMIQPIYLPKGINLPQISEIKRSVTIPVLAVGSITSPEMIEEVLAVGNADFVALGRPLLADPFFVKKAKEGRLEDIRPCIRCNEGCVGRVRKLFSVGCTVNAATGEERKYSIVPSADPKNVVVIGGGPAGLEAARVAALRGHKVSVCDKGEELGGALLLGRLPRNKTEIEEFRVYLVNQLKKLNVSIRLREEVTFEAVSKMKPDVIIVAIGAEEILPEIPGIDSEKVCFASDVLLGNVKIGEKVAIIGGGPVGCETAYTLHEDGHKNVTVIEVLEEVLSVNVPELAKMSLMRILKDRGIRLMTSTYVTAITDEGIRVMSATGELGLVEADSVVVAVGFKARRDLSKELENDYEVYSIGDCVTTSGIYNAVHWGAFIGREI
jgi:2,4-dienoyl-CoA reductase-like NADH-dependent reductase (Old Yellow Enzyme family)/thioredoxin reductase